MLNYGDGVKEVEINVVGSSIFGRYPKISTERTINMFESDGFLVPYAGYEVALSYSMFGGGTQGRAIFTSTKLDVLVVVIGSGVFLVTVTYDQTNQNVIASSVIQIGTLETVEGTVYITENNKPQILISDGAKLYVYDPSYTGHVFSTPKINFTPGYISFHDNYFLCAASNDYTDGEQPVANNTWRLSESNEGSDIGGAGTGWPSTAAYVGSLETKPDNTQAIVRFPSKGNMILVMGRIVTEAWFDVGAQLFPYQRNNQFNIDYGCLSPATVAYMDEVVVWLGQNEKSGPIILLTTGGEPEKITTDGIDYLFAQLQNPQDSEAFLYRQDGHLFYHINFYSDNLSLFYDISTKKFYNACDQNFNYFIASDVAFYDNQYYFISRNNGNMFAFDTIFTTFQDYDKSSPTPVLRTYIIPRVRICKNIRSAKQDYFRLIDIGFTIESGETDYQVQSSGDAGLVTQDNFFLVTQDGYYLVLQEGSGLINTTPAVDLSLSYDGGAVFGNQVRYELPAIGVRKNRLLWWQGGVSNDIVPQFTFWGIGRFVVTQGVAHIRE